MLDRIPNLNEILHVCTVHTLHVSEALYSLELKFYASSHFSILIFVGGRKKNLR